VIPHGLYASAFWVTMNKKTWDGLTSVQKKGLETAGGIAGSRFIGSRWDAIEKMGKSVAKKNGNIINTLSSDDTATFKKMISFIEQDWIKKVAKSGADGKALLADLRATVKKYEKIVMSK
jgi:TRAP-type C4-dicarboxylate transport system substrate-binding protein